MRLTILLMVLSLMMVSCGDRTDSDSQDRSETQRRVAVTFFPMQAFCQRLLGDEVPVVCPLPKGEDPIFWNPSDDALAEYRSARLIVMNGAGFEKWAETKSLPKSRVVATAYDLPGGFIEISGGSHSHGGQEHSHDGLDGHTWLNPNSAIYQVKQLGAALRDAFPDQSSKIQANEVGLVSDLQKLHERWATVSPRLKKASLLASHPAYNYLAREFGWDLLSHDFDPQSDLLPHEWGLLKRNASDRPTLMLWESEPLASTAERLKADCAITSVVIEPLENPDGVMDYFHGMNQNLDRLESALTGLGL